MVLFAGWRCCCLYVASYVRTIVDATGNVMNPRYIFSISKLNVTNILFLSFCCSLSSGWWYQPLEILMLSITIMPLLWLFWSSMFQDYISYFPSAIKLLKQQASSPKPLGLELHTTYYSIWLLAMYAILAFLYFFLFTGILYFTKELILCFYFWYFRTVFYLLSPSLLYITCHILNEVLFHRITLYIYFWYFRTVFPHFSPLFCAVPATF